MHLLSDTKYQPLDCHPVCGSPTIQDLYFESLTSGFTAHLGSPASEPTCQNYMAVTFQVLPCHKHQAKCMLIFGKVTT